VGEMGTNVGNTITPARYRRPRMRSCPKDANVSASRVYNATFAIFLPLDRRKISSCVLSSRLDEFDSIVGP